MLKAYNLIRSSFTLEEEEEEEEGYIEEADRKKWDVIFMLTGDVGVALHLLRLMFSLSHFSILTFLGHSHHLGDIY